MGESGKIGTPIIRASLALMFHKPGKSS